MEQTLKQRQILKRSILDRGFKYTPAAKTDIRKLFARVMREQKQQQK